MGQLKTRLALNLGANAASQGTGALLQLALVPLFLSFWSKERYGAWILMSSVPVYLSLGEAGFATAAANEVSMAVAHGDLEQARRSLHTAWGFLVAVSAGLCGAALAGCLLLPWGAWLKFPGRDHGEVRWVLLLLSLYTVLAFSLGILGAVYRAAYRFARYALLGSAGRVLEVAAMGASLALSGSMVALAGAMLAARAATLAFQFSDSRRLSPNVRLGLSRFCWLELGRIWRPSVLFMAVTGGNALYFQGLTLLVGGMLGAGAVVVFSTTRALTRAIPQFVAMIKHSVWPEFSYLFGAGDLARARRLNALAFEVSCLASVALAAATFFLAPWILPLWTRRAVAADPLLLGCFLASAVLNGVWFVTSGLLMGVNQHQGLAVRYVLAAAFALLLAALLVPHWKLPGAAAAMIACEALLLPYAISRTCRALRCPALGLIRDSLQLRMCREALRQHAGRWFPRAGATR
jgi:O-antigen/teichoic acid export membrane protein